MTLLLAFAVFVSTAFVEAAWTEYISAVASVSRTKAMLWNGILIAASAILVKALVLSGWYVVPAVLGGMLGTWISLL